MQLGEVIRKHRKENNLTQDEVAKRLGVSAPAVNKWENGSSFPDIMLLAPISRLFNITTDELLSYREELAQEEINQFANELNEMFKKEPYQKCFAWAKKKVEKYPNCESLIWQVAILLDSQRMRQKIVNSEIYEDYCYSLYNRVIDSKNEMIQNRAASSLYEYYMRKKQYDKAEEYLQYFPYNSTERKMKKARILAETDCDREAYKAYEEIALACYSKASAALHGIYLLALHQNDRKKAHEIVDKQVELAKCFEMGKYHEMVCKLELATIEKDADTTSEIMKEMLSPANDILDFQQSSMYEHMEFRHVDEELRKEMRENLKKCFDDEETYGFLNK